MGQSVNPTGPQSGLLGDWILLVSRDELDFTDLAHIANAVRIRIRRILQEKPRKGRVRS